jgi:hypothetical protein
MSQDQQARSSNAPLEPMSPELALVDPEAARRARERLELFDGSPATGFSANQIRIRPSTAPSVRDRLLADGTDPDLLIAGPETSEELPRLEAPDQPPAAPARSRRRTVLAVTATVLATIAGMAALALVSLRSRSDEAVARTTPAATAGGDTARSTGKVAAGRPRKGRARREVRSQRSKPPARVTNRKPPRRVVRTTRTFVWPSVPRATRYRVEFFRRGRKIFEASPLRPRLELPQRWQYKGRRFRLTRGTYRWRVRPAFGRFSPRLGQPITSSTWIVR